MPLLTDVRLVDAGAALGAFRTARSDPTCRLDRSGSAGKFVRATLTPDGPGTLCISWQALLDADRTDPAVDAEAWGPGGPWLLARVNEMVGWHDKGPGHLTSAPDPIVARAATEHRTRRLGSSRGLYHALVPTVIEQRITAGEAKRQWHQLCHALSDPAPGPFPSLLLPPDPQQLARTPSWWFHPLGIERSRAQTLREVARHAPKYWEWVSRPPADVGRLLHLIPGVGQWTVGSVLGPVMGDADAVAVGDYHLKNIVTWALTGEPRGSDERMMELLAPYAGDRGRVAGLLKSTVGAAPKYGPRQRILPMHRW